MPIVTWSALGTGSGNIAGTALNSLANGTASAVISYANGTARALYARIVLDLASFTPTAGGSVTLRILGHDGTNFEDNLASGHLYTDTAALTTTASAKRVIFSRVGLYPWTMGLVIVNNSGAAFAASGHSLVVTPYNEEST